MKDRDKNRDIVLDFKTKENEVVSSLYFSSKFYGYKMLIGNEVLVLEKTTGRNWRYRYKGFSITRNQIRFFVEKKIKRRR